MHTNNCSRWWLVWFPSSSLASSRHLQAISYTYGDSDVISSYHIYAICFLRHDHLRAVPWHTSTEAVIYHIGQASSGLYSNTVWHPRFRRNIDLLESVQHRATRIINGLKKLPYEERLRVTDLPPMESSQRGSIKVFQVRIGNFRPIYLCISQKWYNMLGQLLWKANRNSDALYRTVLFPTTLRDP